MKRIRIHVLYEYGIDLRPHGSAYLRLIRPFLYPEVSNRVDVTFGRDMGDAHPDLVMVDRLWRPDISPQKVQALAEAVHQRGAKLIFWFDDNFLQVGFGAPQVRELRKASFQRFLELSDGFVVTTPALMETFPDLKSRTRLLENCLDERLIVRKNLNKPTGNSKLRILYMGTATHDKDLKLVLPALQAVNEKYPGRLHFQFIGALDDRRLKDLPEITTLPYETIQPHPVEIEYPLFMTWFTGSSSWDIGIAPLVDDSFNYCKSDIKFLDYSAAGVPGVFSAVNAYASSVVHQKTGILAQNDVQSWGSALQALIEDDKMRRMLVQEAQDYLFEKRILRQTYDRWLKTSYEFL